MKIKPKIAVIGLKGVPAFGGAAAVGENIIEQLKTEYSFTVYSTSSHTNCLTGDLNGYKQIVLKKFPIIKLNTLYYYIVSSLHALVFCKYDLVHLHHRDAAFITLILKLKYKVILTTHNSFCTSDKWKRFSWFFQLNERKFVKYANVITCVSKEEQRLYKKLLGIETVYIPNGINIFENGDSTRENIDNDIYLFFGAGRIMGTKGLEVLLKALHILDFKGDLKVAGDLDQVPGYRNEILNLSEGLNVKYLGLIKNKSNLLSIIANANLFIFPSSIEAMSMMLLEAASTKCPCIVSDIIQNKDVFNSNEVLFFETNNSEDLAKKIHFALNNIEIMKSKANSAYNKLVNTQQWKHIAMQYKAIYEQLLHD